ncbi:MAG: cytochrome c3 family protein [Acidobacteriaceae bacterium]
MRGPWRTLLLLALAAFLVQPAMQIPTTYAATAQNSAAAPGPAPTTSPEAVQGPVQPIPFSHKEHAGTLKLPCEYCHAPSRSGETLKIPQAAFCMQCHQTMATENPGVEKLAAYAKSNALVPWIRVYQLPSFVTFSHKTHLSHGITCEQCHGQVADQVRVYKAMDISMGTCIKCHTARHASIDCNTCHMLNQ